MLKNRTLPTCIFIYSNSRNIWANPRKCTLTVSTWIITNNVIHSHSTFRCCNSDFAQQVHPVRGWFSWDATITCKEMLPEMQQWQNHLCCNSSKCQHAWYSTDRFDRFLSCRCPDQWAMCTYVICNMLQKEHGFHLTACTNDHQHTTAQSHTTSTLELDLKPSHKLTIKFDTVPCLAVGRYSLLTGSPGQSQNLTLHSTVSYSNRRLLLQIKRPWYYQQWHTDSKHTRLFWPHCIHAGNQQEQIKLQQDMYLYPLWKATVDTYRLRTFISSTQTTKNTWSSLLCFWLWSAV